MAKYISIFFLCLFVSFFFIFGNGLGGGDPAETAIYKFEIVTVILISFLISLMYYLIDLIKGNNKRVL